MVWKHKLLHKYRNTITAGSHRVRYDLSVGTYVSKTREFGNEYCNDDMSELAGQIVEIVINKSTSGKKTINVTGPISEYRWIDCMFEEYKHLESSFEHESFDDDEYEDDDEMED